MVAKQRPQAFDKKRVEGLNLVGEVFVRVVLHGPMQEDELRVVRR
jgi:hypothetical protein